MIHLGKNTRSTIISKGISAGKSQNSYRGLVQVGSRADNARNFSQCDSLLMGTRIFKIRSMLKINDLHASVEDKEILKGINLSVNAGEVHAIMGPNGSGKSTLASVIAGKEEFEVTKGSVVLNGEDLEDDSPEDRAHKGVFLSFQYPVEIPGVSVTNFMKTAINESRKARGQEDMPAKEMLKLIRDKSEMLEIDRKFLSRSLNQGFSGGEKKRNEIFQMAMLEPKLAILDETDSGLDIDALRIRSKRSQQIKE
ncbi:putative ATP-dependent transporter SufC [Nymphon striatum]|nr:putative ATP-dependent transporter SufC [Nymphon striatum]